MYQNVSLYIKLIDCKLFCFIYSCGWIKHCCPNIKDPEKNILANMEAIILKHNEYSAVNSMNGSNLWKVFATSESVYTSDISSWCFGSQIIADNNRNSMTCATVESPTRIHFKLLVSSFSVTFLLLFQWGFNQRRELLLMSCSGKKVQGLRCGCEAVLNPQENLVFRFPALQLVLPGVSHS